MSKSWQVLGIIGLLCCAALAFPTDKQESAVPQKSIVEISASQRSISQRVKTGVLDNLVVFDMRITVNSFVAARAACLQARPMTFNASGNQGALFLRDEACLAAPQSS